MANKDDDIIVRDNGNTFETQESTLTAKQYADQAKLEADRAEENANLAEQAISITADYKDLAKDWAQKTDGKVVEDGEEVDYSAKHYAQLSQGLYDNIVTEGDTQVNRVIAEGNTQVERVTTIGDEKVTAATNAANSSEYWAEQSQTFGLLATGIYNKSLRVGADKIIHLRDDVNIHEINAEDFADDEIDVTIDYTQLTLPAGFNYSFLVRIINATGKIVNVDAGDPVTWLDSSLPESSGEVWINYILVRSGLDNKIIGSVQGVA